MSHKRQSQVQVKEQEKEDEVYSLPHHHRSEQYQECLMSMTD